MHESQGAEDASQEGGEEVDELLHASNTFNATFSQ